MLDYRLIVVTHGDAPNLERVLASFEALVSPAPRERVLVVDGPGRIPTGMDGWDVWGASQQAGFCATYERVWRAARETELPFVFLLENDFMFLKPVDVEEMALPLLMTENASSPARPPLAQIALVRQAVNEQEIAAGGLIESRPGEFEKRTLAIYRGGETTSLPLLEHGSFFTTNPCLFPSRLAHDEPWPTERKYCEGLYGIQLRAAGYRFAFWGDGEPWVTHVGERTGFGY